MGEHVLVVAAQSNYKAVWVTNVPPRSDEAAGTDCCVRSSGSARGFCHYFLV